VPGVEISNSPTAVAARDWQGLTLIQRSSAGTQGAAAAAAAAGQVLAASLVVAAATAREVARRKPPQVTLVAMGEESGHPEDRACALYLEGLLAGRPADLAELLKPLFESERYARLQAGAWPGFPATDLELSLQADRFDFAMPVTEAAGRLVLRRS
jgi:2-phosphosulfolactate phosphatase